MKCQSRFGRADPGWAFQMAGAFIFNGVRRPAGWWILVWPEDRVVISDVAFRANYRVR